MGAPGGNRTREPRVGKSHSRLAERLRPLDHSDALSFECLWGSLYVSWGCLWSDIGCLLSVIGHMGCLGMFNKLEKKILVDKEFSQLETNLIAGQH